VAGFELEASSTKTRRDHRATLNPEGAINTVTHSRTRCSVRNAEVVTVTGNGSDLLNDFF